MFCSLGLGPMLGNSYANLWIKEHMENPTEQRALLVCDHGYDIVGCHIFSLYGYRETKEQFHGERRQCSRDYGVFC